MNGHHDTHQMALPTGYQLEQYRIEAQLGHGGFGITYRALDTRLDRQVAIKEYLPRDLAFRNSGQTVQAISQSDHEMFEWGLERFLDEARTLAKFNHPNIVRVLQFFRANDTAYLVMEYCDGEPLDQILQREGRLQPDQVLQITNSLLDALTEFHKLDVIHRDIKPANIYIRSDGTPVLLDFGSARQAVGGRSRSMTSVISPHYAAFEQYSSRGKQGPWTDLYGLAATLYHCITGKRPPEATDRIEHDELTSLTCDAGSQNLPKAFLQAIDFALQPLARDRLQTANQWVASIASQIEDPLPSIKIEQTACSHENIVDNKTTPDLVRSSFETEQEYQNRLTNNQWYLGEARLLHDEYCLKTQRFPVQLDNIASWAKPYIQSRRLYINIFREDAKLLFQTKKEWPIICNVNPSNNNSFSISSLQLVGIRSNFHLFGRYLDHGNGTLTDLETGLMWMQPCYGQVWNSGQAIGKPIKMNWDSAMNLYPLVFAEYFDWRLPSIEELQTLIYCSSNKRDKFDKMGFGGKCLGDFCRPTISLTGFKGSPIDGFWSSTPYGQYSDRAWGVDFYTGQTGYNKKTSKCCIRLVRSTI